MRHSPLLSAYASEAFEIGEVNDMNIALRAKSARLPSDYVADLSAIRRRLFVGRPAAYWLAEHDIDVPAGLLKYNELESGAIIVRLHRHQYLLVDSIDGSAYDNIFSLVEGRQDDILVVAFEAAEIACGGPHAEDLLTELCPMDIS